MKKLMFKCKQKLDPPLNILHVHLALAELLAQNLSKFHDRWNDAECMWCLSLSCCVGSILQNFSKICSSLADQWILVFDSKSSPVSVSKSFWKALSQGVVRSSHLGFCLAFRSYDSLTHFFRDLRWGSARLRGRGAVARGWRRAKEST